MAVQPKQLKRIQIYAEDHKRLKQIATHDEVSMIDAFARLVRQNIRITVTPAPTTAMPTATWTAEATPATSEDKQ